ncbi:MAG: hypothetical protein R2710_11070 [Acidimicrobiales bacterium]
MASHRSPARCRSHPITWLTGVERAALDAQIGRGGLLDLDFHVGGLALSARVGRWIV